VARARAVYPPLAGMAVDVVGYRPDRAKWPSV